jgi:predicted Zn-dependent protease
MNTSTDAILAALQTGRQADAEQLCRSRLREIPGDENALVLLGMLLEQQERAGEALEVFAELTQRQPGSGLHWGNYATALRTAGRLDEALAAYETSLRLTPDDPAQLLNLGMLQLELRQYESARNTLLRAHHFDPQSPAARIYAARACAVFRDYRAEQLIRPWREWLPLDDAQQLELADLQLLLSEANAAGVVLEELLSRSPQSQPAMLLLAAVYERMNRLDDAEHVLDVLAALPSQLDDIALNEIVHQRAKLAQRRGQLQDAREALERAGPRLPGDYSHYFALAEVCDKLDARDDAMHALHRAHALQVEELKATEPYRFEPEAMLLPAAERRVSADDYRQWPRLQSPDETQSPVFIVGFPRSGTTLLEQMLDAHPALQSMDERPFFNILSDQLGDHGLNVPQDIHKFDQGICDELRKGYLSLVCSKIERRWSARLVDKNPLNMLWLPLIHRLFPNARFILALRHPCDVVLSCYMQNFRANVLAAACADVERLATAYVTAMEAWLHHVEVFQPKVLVSRYEDLVSQTEQQTRRIAEFIGLEDPSPMLHFDRHAREKGFIATPSYTQVIQPVNRKGMDRWLRYRDALAPALPILQPMLAHWGYDTTADASSVS